MKFYNSTEQILRTYDYLCTYTLLSQFTTTQVYVIIVYIISIWTINEDFK